MNGFFSMNGRLGRAGYFWRTVAITLVMYVASFGLGIMMGFSGATDDTAGAVGTLVGIVAAVLVAFQAVKRLHDLGRPGTHYWLFFIPFYNVYMGLVLLFQKGTTGTNVYGPDPVA